jgi:hypothetical protein
LWLQAYSTGGAGGATSGGGDAGDGGAAGLGGITQSTALPDRVRVNVYAVGGDGGFASGGGASGDGAGVHLVDAANATASDDAELVQSAYGGNAGGVDTETALVGAAGNASSSLTTVGALPSLTVFVAAFGGKGGSRAASSGVAGDGGGATVNANATNTGGDARVLGGVLALAPSLSVGGVGGTGSLGAASGNGGDASMSSVATVGTTGSANAQALAVGGDGGAVFDGSSTQAGNGGNASAIAEATTSSGSRALATSYSAGAAGGVVAGTGNGGAGGRAAASASASEGNGVFAQASSFGGLVKLLEAQTSSSLTGGSVAAEAGAVVSGPAHDLASVDHLQGAAFATGLPSTADALAALAGRANSAAAMLGSGHALGLVALGGGVASDADATSITFESSVAFQLDLSQLSSSGSLVVGLLDPEVVGAGFDSLQFQILREGIAAVNETFLDVASALAYFDDHVLDLGAIADGVSGDLDLDFLLSLTSDDPGAAFRADLIFANVPEPELAWLLGGGLAALALRERKRAAPIQL